MGPKVKAKEKVKEKAKEKPKEKAKSNKSTSPATVVNPPSVNVPSVSLEQSSSGFDIIPRCMSLTLIPKGTPPGSGEFVLLAMFNGLILLEGKWEENEILQVEILPIDLNDPIIQDAVANTPLILILRIVGGKGGKDPDPLVNPDNRGGASVDLFPLLLGEEKVTVRLHLVSLSTGEQIGCSVIVDVYAPDMKEDHRVPLVLSMISVHCLPVAKDGTLYLSAIALNELHTPIAIPFHSSLSTASAKKLVFANVSTGGQAANTAINIDIEDKFIPNDLKPRDEPECRSFYWNAMTRVLVDPKDLCERLSAPFMIEVAGISAKGGKDIRGRFMGLIDAQVLLEPGQMSVTVCSTLFPFNEAYTPGGIGALLELPPMSAKSTARDMGPILDEHGHNAYAIVRFDLTEALVPESKLEVLYEILGFPLPDNADIPQTNLGIDTVHVDTVVGARTIRKEGGALAVHKELSGLASKGNIPMNQGIKRTAANRLLMRVRAALKSFPPGECSRLDWEDTVTGQHAASRRAVTASFAPQPPPLRLPDKAAAARCRIAGDTRIAERHIETNLKVAGTHPRSLISKTLRCLEERKDVDAKHYLFDALTRQARNRYLLWIYGGLEFEHEMAGVALCIAVRGEYSDGTANSIGWAAVHAYHHCNGNMYAAFVAAKNMRKARSLPVEWDKFIARWTDSSGEEEVYWIPAVIDSNNPMLIAAAFFLCLRCYRFAEKLLQCVEHGCACQGSAKLKCKITPDVYYLRAASLILRGQPNAAIEKVTEGISKFGPKPIMAQMRVTCLNRLRNWDHECEKAINDAEKAGSELCPSLLYSASLYGFKSSPMVALHRAAHAHKNSPSGHTALLIGRIYAALGNEWLAERWLAAAVNTEPLLADGWAMLALLAMYKRNLEKARMMLRTARQVGPLSSDLEEEVKIVMKKVRLDQMSDSLVKDLCLCDYF